MKHIILILISLFVIWNSYIFHINTTGTKDESNLLIADNPSYTNIRDFSWQEYNIENDVYTEVTWNFSQEFSDFFKNVNVYTNDNSWDIIPLNIEKSPITSGYREFFYEWDTDYWYWEDEDTVYLFWTTRWVKKDYLNSFIPLQDLWTQDLEWIIWYSDGYLIVFPFKFPVDKNTFLGYQNYKTFPHYKSDAMNDLDLYRQETQNRRVKFINNWILYDKCIWFDDEYIYFRATSERMNTYIGRVKKSEDFSIIN